MKEAEQSTEEPDPVSDRAYELADEMQQQIRPHDSDDDIFNALQVLVFGMNDDHPEVFDRVLKYYSHEVLGQFFRVMGKKQEEELNEKENKD